MTLHKKIAFALSSSLLLGVALPAMAATATVSVSSAVSQKLITRGDTDTTARIAALGNLGTRVAGMKNVSATEKTTLSSEIQTETEDMTSLKAKVDADTDAATLKTDVASITGGYRIYALIIPQGLILAAADRLTTITADFATVTTKLQTRITAAQSAGKDVTALEASLTDLQAKISDANLQAQTAITNVSALVPDQGDKTKLAANTAALKQARADLRVGNSDIQSARKDAGSIIKALQASHASVTASSTVTTQ